jgi:hypothetical protein
MNEPKRGCGYRKAGGLYLMAGRPAAPCGKLPLKLTVCPTCGQGIKPARGWTWVNGKKLFEGVQCKYDHELAPSYNECSTCRLFDPPDKMGLLWIGEKFYKSPEEFLAEGMAQGISRRITAIPHDFESGKTWVLFAHRKAIECQTCHTVGKVGESIRKATTVFDHADLDPCPDCGGGGYFAGVFSCFLPERIEYIVKDDDTEETLERLEKRGVTLIRLVRTDDGNGNGVLDVQLILQELLISSKKR